MPTCFPKNKQVLMRQQEKIILGAGCSPESRCFTIVLLLNNYFFRFETGIYK
jgi:hypothetical protein